MHNGPLLTAAVNLNGPGRYLHWSIFTVSEANLVLIAVMVVIFGAALLIPFPRHTAGDQRARRRRGAEAPTGPPAAEQPRRPGSSGRDLGDDADAAMWTSRLRRRALRLLPPGKLLPDRQPAYVASWIYVFGVASLATLGMVIVSGFAIALGGPDWWHTDPVGHFFNSLHLWSVEAFMAFMVIHLWGKFWMAAWRGRRAMTWVTGVVAFMASIVECFTGYVSQQNFDSQWISTSGKDAFNAVGVGAFFNVMNFGQMLMWHIVLIPLVLVAIVGAHVLAVRVRGVAHPLPDAARPGPGGAAGGRRRRPGRLAGPHPALRHRQGSHRGQPGGRHPGRRPGRPVVFSRRAARDHRHLGQGRPGRLRRHGGQRARRDQRDGHVRAPLTTTARAALQSLLFSPSKITGVPPAHRRRPDLRPRSPGEERTHRPGARRSPRPLQCRLGQAPSCRGPRLRQRRHQGPLRRRRPPSCPRPPTGPCRSCSPPSSPWPAAGPSTRT